MEWCWIEGSEDVLLALALALLRLLALVALLVLLVLVLVVLAAHILPPSVILLVQVDLATLDLSFISVLKVVPAVVGVMRALEGPDGGGSSSSSSSSTEGAGQPPTAARPPAQLLVLIKPQFEAGRGQVSSGGVVRDPQVGAGMQWPLVCGAGVEHAPPLEQAGSRG